LYPPFNRQSQAFPITAVERCAAERHVVVITVFKDMLEDSSLQLFLSPTILILNTVNILFPHLFT